MAEYERRNHGYKGGRKRRYRGAYGLYLEKQRGINNKGCEQEIFKLTEDAFSTDDDDFDRRAQRRKYEEPLSTKVRKQLLMIADSVRTLPQTLLSPALATDYFSI